MQKAISFYSDGVRLSGYLHSGLTHYDVYKGDGFASVMRETLDWYRTFIPAS
ncbi:MAG: hypothetical protein HYY19_06855 [Candidatus Rokubacteria bacterium]|nr:hypothetical protein [Candidatus Rokubacteria bacterium]